VKFVRAEKPSQRIFVAFSDLAILIALKDYPMTGYGINKYFLKKVGYTASPSTVYASLASLERKRLIECIKNKKGRVYALTAEGEKVANGMSMSVEEIKRFMDKLLKAR
jgi:DNA-binding PadR family transcriptional regulator